MADVIVLGGGIIGLTAAVRLRERGAEVALWSPDDSAATTSAVAAAVWYPTRVDGNPRVFAWAAATYAEFRKQAVAGVPGVMLRPTRNLEHGPDTEPPWWARAAGTVTYGPATAPWTREVRFVAPLADMGRYLPWLRRRFVSAGGRIVRRGVRHLDEALVEAPVVVNATGLGAARLCGDPFVHPARGQVVVVANPGLDTSVRVVGDPGTYVHPREHDVVLGGTWDVDEWDTRPDPAVSEAILARCVALVPQLAGAEVVAERVGLRPARRGGPRVAAQRCPLGTVVHAYGHGGAGMTLSWGCADEIAALALPA
ncbi:FAD-dependent oxidoreductase [Krasilnikovia sp. MM14-A1259]|uniref:FAD-dependent oxidoreductase n=1 Tax=Krasilnikovia sp. MM14-A1259 TaxID=3373539 RepID=UPI0037F3C805